MEFMNEWIADSRGSDWIWRFFWRHFRYAVVGQLTAVFVIFAGRYALPAAGAWRWLGLVVLVALAWRSSFDRPLAVETLAAAMRDIKMPCLKIAKAA